MRFSFFVALRYLRGKRRSAFLGVITLISVAGVGVGVLTLVVAMGIMTGFSQMLRDTLLGNRAHVTVFAPAGAIADPAAVMRELSAMPAVKACSPVVQIEALLKHGGKQTGGYAVGIDPALEPAVTNLAENLGTSDGREHGRGALPGRKQIVLGYRLAERLGADVGDEIGVVTGRAQATPFGVRRASQLWLTVSGISQARMTEFDAMYAYVDLPTARMLGAAPGAEAIQVRLHDPDDAVRVARAIEESAPYDAQAWFETQEAYFQALNQEKMTMFIILVFIVLVAAFNITSTLIMMVMEKRRDIGILRTLGAGTGAILGLFVFEGLLIGGAGAVLGIAAGLVLARNVNAAAAWISSLAGVQLFNPNVYLFDRIPVEIVPGDVAAIAAAAIALSLLSALYPAWSAARLHPVDAIRHE